MKQQNGKAAQQRAAAVARYYMQADASADPAQAVAYIVGRE